MQTDDYRVRALTWVLLVASTGLWIDLFRLGLRHGWSWPVQPRREVPWRPLETVVFIVIVMLCVSALLQQLFKLPPTPPVTLHYVQVTSLFVLLQLVLTPLILALWCPCQWSDFGLRRNGVVEDLRFALWGLLLAQLPVFLCGYPLQAIRSANPHPMLGFLRESVGDQYTLLWIALSVVLMAPLIEELLFRVLLQGTLEREVSPFWAILLTAAAFVSIHSWVDWAPLLPLALILGYIYYRRRSFLSVVILHGLFNGLNLLNAVWSLQTPVISP